MLRREEADALAPGPSLATGISTAILAVMVGVIGWVFMLVAVTWFVRLCAVVVRWAWTVTPWK